MTVLFGAGRCDLISIFLKHEVSLCERTQCSPPLSCFVSQCQGSPQANVPVLYGCEEHALPARRHDPCPARMRSLPRLLGVQIGCKLPEPGAHCGPSFLSDLPFHFKCRTATHFLNLDRRKSRMIEAFSVRLVSCHQLVHHTHESDEVEGGRKGGASLACTFFQQRRISMKHVVLSTPATASRSSLD